MRVRETACTQAFNSTGRAAGDQNALAWAGPLESGKGRRRRVPGGSGGAGPSYGTPARRKAIERWCRDGWLPVSPSWRRRGG